MRETAVEVRDFSASRAPGLLSVVYDTSGLDLLIDSQFLLAERLQQVIADWPEVKRGPKPDPFIGHLVHRVEVEMMAFAKAGRSHRSTNVGSAPGVPTAQFNDTNFYRSLFDMAERHTGDQVGDGQIQGAMRISINRSETSAETVNFMEAFGTLLSRGFDVLSHKNPRKKRPNIVNSSD